MQFQFMHSEYNCHKNKLTDVSNKEKNHVSHFRVLFEEVVIKNKIGFTNWSSFSFKL
jgi:hypothetical protein